ncbi:hypothetical protein [Pseudomonas sp. CGJS7]|uniref:hypothetical protein n=1 Tax=Pseudomonas sp. CGJS7 TaxID=3109348 RepID=UPI00300917A4
MQTPTPPSAAAAVPFRPVLLGMGLLLSSLCAIAPIWVVPQFKQVFVSFGTDLPPATRLLVDYPWALCALPLLVLAIWAVSPRRWRDLLACVVGVALAAGGIAFMSWALYLPIFMLGATI